MNRLAKISVMMVLMTGFLWSSPFEHRFAYGEVVAQVAQADEQNKDEHTTEASKKAAGKLKKSQDFATETWNRISDWVMGYVNTLKSEVDKVFAFDEGAASGVFFGWVLYAGVALVLLFVILFIKNIISDMLSGVKAKKRYKKRR